jgi:aspartyl-tRNA(Asn)/glutamyl-tRNA(Gln) amidotransferase subunit B
LRRGDSVIQETLGWDESEAVTVSQRSKEDAHDYRYFPEPDLPPLVVESSWVDQVKGELPELPRPRSLRFQEQYGIPKKKAYLLAADSTLADYFEQCLQNNPHLGAQTVFNWISGEIFGWLNRSGESMAEIKVPPGELTALLQLLKERKINQPTAKNVLAEMLKTGKGATDIIAASGLQQVSDMDKIAQMVQRVIEESPKEVGDYLQGKETISNWLFGQVMRLAGGKADPLMVKETLNKRLKQLK